MRKPKAVKHTNNGGLTLELKEKLHACRVKLSLLRELLEADHSEVTLTPDALTGASAFLFEIEQTLDTMAEGG